MYILTAEISGLHRLVVAGAERPVLGNAVLLVDDDALADEIIRSGAGRQVSQAEALELANERGQVLVWVHGDESRPVPPVPVCDENLILLLNDRSYRDSIAKLLDRPRVSCSVNELGTLHV